MRAMFLLRLGYLQQSLFFADESMAAAESCLAENWAENEADPQYLVVKVFAQYILGMIYINLGEYEKAQTLLESGLQIVDGHGTQVSELARDLQWQLRFGLGSAFIEMNDYPLAREYMQQALAICQTSGQMRGQLTCLGNLGWIELQAGNYEAARQAYERALPLSHTFGYRVEEAANLVELGDTVRLQGEYGLALQYLQDGWSMAYEINTYQHANEAVLALASLYCQVGDYPQAQKWLDRWHRLDGKADGMQEVAHALLAYHQGAYRPALDAATQAWQLVNKSSNRSAKAKTLLVIGHAQASLRQWREAADAYAQALTLYTALNLPAFAVEARAGLATVALNQSDAETAIQQVELILPVLAEASYVGMNEPFYTYWICYRVLTALQDSRAASLLESAYRQLQRFAGNIGDEPLCRSFWGNVPVHGNLAAAYLRSRL
jgi:tetratricopeptide (TPR) repeat protein